METTKKAETTRSELVDIVLSWSIEEVLNKNLYKNKVKKIPMAFQSTTEYMNSFIYPLLEETRMEVCSEMQNVARSPVCVISSLETSKFYKPPKDLFYNITTTTKMKDNYGRFRVMGSYEPEAGDLLAITNVKPRRTEDIHNPRFGYRVAFVYRMKDEETGKTAVLTSRPLYDDDEDDSELYALYIGNLTTNVRVWKGLHPDDYAPKSKIMDIAVASNCLEETSCMICSSLFDGSNLGVVSSSGLNDSQKDAISTVIKMSQCDHQSSIKLIWGPPGTGKTTTLATCLAALVKLKVRTVACAPTNTAVLQVASRLRNVLDNHLVHGMYGLGDVVLVGNGNRMKVKDHEDIMDVFLDHRAKALSDCFFPSTGWNHTIISSLNFLEDPCGQHMAYLEKLEEQKEMLLEMLLEDPGRQYKEQLEKLEKEIQDNESLDEFAKKKLSSLLPKMVSWIETLCTHLPTHILSLEVANTMMLALESLDNFTTHDLWSLSSRENLISALKLLPQSFNLLDFWDVQMIKEFCLGNAKLIMCTATGTARLQTEESKSVQLVVIDEAAQLKECESIVPLQLPGLQHAVLVGDERQLPTRRTCSPSASAL